LNADQGKMAGGLVAMSTPIPREALRRWAATKPTIKALYVFGSYARGEARPGSDLDLAFEFTGVDEADAELICNAKAWKAELILLTGIAVKDLYHSTAAPARNGPTVQVFP
jgi:predicted nucleotidyltransferase